MIKNKIYLKIILGIIAAILVIKFLTIVLVEPQVRKKIETTLNEKNRDYIVSIDKVHILIISSGIELSGIKIRSIEDYSDTLDLYGEIASIKFKGIKLAKAIFSKDIKIREIVISESNIMGKIPFPREDVGPIILPLNIRIGSVFFEKLNLSVGNSSTSATYSVKDGILKLYELRVKKQDTLSTDIVKQFDFEAEELVSVTSDSMYTFIGGGMIYSGTSNTLEVDSFSVDPNYKDYDFTSRYKFQVNHIEAGFSNIYAYDFRLEDYFSSGTVKSSFIEVGKMDINVFKDKRKEFKHVNKPEFQDLIYNYPGILNIDSIGLLNGNITYTVHHEKANEPGYISFNDVNARIYKITNDTIYKTDSAFFKLKSNGLLMGKSRIAVILKARIFDSKNTFSLNGTLSALDLNELNPILENNAFMYVTSGKINSMNFSFTANHTKADGKMTMLYDGLDIAVKNKMTDDTTGFKARFISMIVNIKVMDSNPLPGKDIREGIIEFERDPERYLFHYCFRAILSGFQSSLQRDPGK